MHRIPKNQLSVLFSATAPPNLPHPPPSPSPPPPPPPRSDLNWGPVLGTAGVSPTILMCPTGSVACGVNVYRSGNEAFTGNCCFPMGLSLMCTDGSSYTALLSSGGMGWAGSASCASLTTPLQSISASYYDPWSIIIGLAGVGDDFGTPAGRACGPGSAVAALQVQFSSDLQGLTALSVACAPLPGRLGVFHVAFKSLQDDYGNASYG